MPQIIKCGMIQRQLTKKRYDSNQKSYCYIKGAFWASLYNDNMRPIHWNKPTSAGTKCTCVPITTATEQEAARLDLINYCNQCNEKYPDLLKIKFEGGEDHA
jgi:hypothetical protein